MKVGLLVMPALLLLPVLTVQAQQANSPQDHALHNAQSPYYNGPRSGAVQGAPAPRATGYWEKTWGAIAPSTNGILGTSVGARNESDARRIALDDCRAKGGERCNVDIAYRNQCAVMTAGDTVYNTGSAPSIELASELGMKECKKSSKNCRVYYSACTEPVFHRY